jgi:predicted nuclease of predicted toxin-antitoxin system
MTKLSFYFDEDIQRALADALRTRGIDVFTTHQAGNVGADDIRQLAYAAEIGRTILSYNKRHFALLHYEWMNVGRPHAGIILSDQLSIGVILRRFMKLYHSLNQDDMKNRLEYLGSWK